MFCYNCGNQIDAGDCPFCNRVLPPLNPEQVEKSRQHLSAPQTDSIDDEAEFVPGELPVYEKYHLEKTNTLFGLVKVIRFVIELLADDAREVPNYLKGIFTEIRIHRDKLILRQCKKCWILPTPFIKTYGRKEKTAALREVTALVRANSNLLLVQFGNQEFQIPTDSEFKPDGLVYNLKTANPAIQFTDRTAR